MKKKMEFFLRIQIKESSYAYENRRKHFGLPRFFFIFVAFTGYIIPYTMGYALYSQIIISWMHNDISEASKFAGYLKSCSSFSTFLTAPLIGTLSDKYGRKPLFLLSMIGYFIDLSGYLFIRQPSALWFTATLAGFLSGTYSIAYAMLADISIPEERSKNFGLLGISVGLSLLIGQLGGGFLAERFNLYFPLYIAFGIAIVNFLFIIIFLPETKARDDHPFAWRRAIPLASFRILFQNKYCLCLAIFYFFSFIAEEGIVDVMIMYMKYTFGFGPFQISVFFAIMGVCFIFVQGLGIRIILRFFGERRSLLFALFVDSSTSCFYALIPSTMSYLLFPLYIFRSFALISSPIVQGMISKEFPKEKQGELSGILASLKTITAFIGPLIFNNLFAYYISSNAWPFKLPGVVFYIGAVIWFLCFGALLVIYRVFPQKKIVSVEEVEEEEEEEEKESNPVNNEKSPLLSKEN